VTSQSQEQGQAHAGLAPFHVTGRPPLRIEWPSQPDRPGEPVRLRDRWCFLFVFLTALLVFVSTDTGRMIFDTKLGVDIDTAGFLSRLWQLWNPLEWFGTLQNQYIGYAVPMAPFFLLGQFLHVPVWVIERLWLATVVTAGFAGLVKLARALRIGTDGSRLLAGGVFVLWPTYTIVIGSTSAAALPGLVVPWAILPLVGAVPLPGRKAPSARKALRPAGRAAALSGLAVAAMGGVNAASTGYVLVLPALFILIAASGRLRLSLLAKWAAAALAGTAWWLVPLLLQGRYSFNFLPYIEQADTTFRYMSAGAFLRGAGNWTAYLNLGTPWLSAGWAEVTSPATILASATAAGAGLYGLARRDMPHRRWLLACVGVACAVALAGYWGPLGGPLSGPADTLFNGILAPLRSVYKIEPVVAVALALGCAHAVSHWARGELPLRAGRVPRSAALAPLAALVLAGLAVPQLSGQVLQPGSFSAVPGYWEQAAAFLSANSSEQTALVVPADSHGLYLWGDPIDDPMEPLASSPWAERALVPYGGAGSQVFLDTAEQAVESDRAVPGLPAYLARAGIRYVVVRNDLDPAMIGYASPQIVNETLALSGFARVASFGPRIPSSPSYPQAQTPVPGQAPSYPAVEVFQAVDPALRPAGPVTTLPVDQTVLVNGGPDAFLQLAGQGVVTRQPAVIAGDPLPVRPELWAVTDGQRRTDNEFGLTTQNVSFTYTATGTNPPDDQLGGSGDPPRQILPVPAAGHQTVAVLSGAAQVTASSYGDWLTQAPQYDPVNAFDGDPATAWAEGSPYTPVGQWIQISFDRTLDLPASIGIQLLVDSPIRSVASQVRVSTAAGGVTTTLTDTGTRQTLRVPRGPADWLRLTITGASNVVPGDPGAGFASVLIPGVRVIRYLQPAEDPAGTLASSAVYSFRQQAAPATGPVQDPVTGEPGPQASQVLARTFQMPPALVSSGQPVTETATAVAVPGPALDHLVSGLAPASGSAFQVTASSTWGSLPRYGPDNLFSSASTVGPASSGPWIAAPSDTSPLLHVMWQGIRTISEMVLSPASGVAAFPASVEVASPQGTRLASVGQGGVVRLVPPLRTSQLSIVLLGAQTAGTGLPVGLSKLTIPGLAGLHVAAPGDGTSFHLACGQGPTVSIDGQKYPTSVSGTVADLIQSLPVQVRLCTPDGGLTLSGGRHWLLAAPSSAFVMTDLDLRTQPGGGAASAARPEGGAASPAAASGGQRTTELLSWQADDRRVNIGPGAESYLEIHENFNVGWSATLNGRPLTPVRLDGWQQAFIVPAGRGGVIMLSYGPATVYHVGLIVSALALAVLAALAIGHGRRRRRGRRRAVGAGPKDDDLTAGPAASRSDDLTAGPAASRSTGPGAGLRELPDPVHRGPGPGSHRGGNESRTWERGRRAARTAAAFVPLAVVVWLAGGWAVAAVPVLACVGWWRPRLLAPAAFGAMLIAGVAVASAGSATATGGGAFGGLAQAAALVGLTAALMPEAGRVPVEQATRVAVGLAARLSAGPAGRVAGRQANRAARGQAGRDEDAT
jgi:arabinofuranan 3-O-arabinosyltransferase